MGSGRTGCGAIVALLGALTGCNTYQAQNQLTPHVIPLDRKGNLGEFKYEDREAADWTKPTPGETVKDHVKLILKTAEAEAKAKGDKRVRLMIHLHGGRKTLEASARMSDEILTVMEAKGEKAEDQWYPVFIHWPSGDLETAGSRLARLRQGRELGPFWGWVSMPFVATYDLGRGFVRLPQSLLFQYFRDASVATEVAMRGSHMKSWRDTKAITAAMVDDGPFTVTKPKYRRSFGSHAWRGLLYLPTQVLKVPIQGLFLEGLGQGAWDEMRRRARHVVWGPEAFEDSREEMSAGEIRQMFATMEPDGVLPELFRQMQERAKDKDDGMGSRYEVLIIAHSMGAIAVNHGLPYIRQILSDSENKAEEKADAIRKENKIKAERIRTSDPDGAKALETKTVEIPANVRVDRIVYMAPACSVGDAAEALVPFLQEFDDTQFSLLALHPIAEADEFNLFDAVPRGSLLEWIDNYYTNPATHTERVFGKWANAIPALGLFRRVEDQVQFKAFDVNGMSSPSTHGGFHSIPFWREEAYLVNGKSSYCSDWVSRECEKVQATH